MGQPLVEVRYDEAKLQRIRRMLRNVPNALPKVMSRAINKTATSARAEITRRIAARAKIKAKAIRQAIVIHKASYKRWQATLNVTHKRIPLIHFGARQLKKGVTYRIEKTGPRKRIKSAFVQTMPVSGHKGVFRRYRATTRRLPIIELYGPSVAGVFEGAAGIARGVQQSALQKLEANIDAQVRYLLSKRRAS